MQESPKPFYIPLERRRYAGNVYPANLTLAAVGIGWRKVGAESNLEFALVATLSPGLYTALLAGANNGTGIGLVEVYDVP